jgi:hypothetical protein
MYVVKAKYIFPRKGAVTLRIYQTMDIDTFMPRAFLRVMDLASNQEASVNIISVNDIPVPREFLAYFGDINGVQFTPMMQIRSDLQIHDFTLEIIN